MDIKACPFCGEKKGVLVTHPKSGDYSVLCVYCSSEGPPRITDTEAVENWNTRGKI